MKRRFLMMGIIFGILAMVVGGATYAYLTDTVQSTGRDFVTGEVSIDSYRDGFDTIPGPMFYTTPEEGATLDNYLGLKATGVWAPGDSVVRSLVVHNGENSMDSVIYQAKAIEESGSNCPAGYTDEMQVKIYKVCPSGWFSDNNNGSAPYLAMNDEEMAAVRTIFNEFLNVSWTVGVPGYAQGRIEEALEHGASYGFLEKIKPVLLWEGSLSDLIASPQEFDNPVYLYNDAWWQGTAVRDGALLAFVVTMDQDAGNSYQNIQPKFQFNVMATQQKNNPTLQP